jgi:hypothetical protein
MCRQVLERARQRRFRGGPTTLPNAMTRQSGAPADGGFLAINFWGEQKENLCFLCALLLKNPLVDFGRICRGPDGELPVFVEQRECLALASQGGGVRETIRGQKHR